MRAASAAVPVGRAHHRALQSGGDAAAPIIQSRQIEKFKTRQVSAAKLAVMMMVSAESDQARMGGRALKHRSSAHHCQSLFKLSVSRAFYLGHRFDAGAPLSSDHTVL